MPLQPGQRRSVADLQKEFVNRYFAGGDAINSQPITLHDAAHQFANISPTTRGELQQGLLDVQGAQNLHQMGMSGFVNASTPDLPKLIEESFDAPDFNPYLFSKPIQGKDVKDAIDTAKSISQSLYTQSMSEPGNVPSNFIFPPVTNKEVSELAKRGSQFYSQVGDQLSRRVAAGQIKAPVSNVIFSLDEPDEDGIQVRLEANPQAAAIHRNPEKIQIKGGYDVPGKLPYGPIEQFMNPPMQMAGLQKGLNAPEETNPWLQMHPMDRIDSDPSVNRFGQYSNQLYGAGSSAGEKLIAPTNINRLRLKNIIGPAATAATDIAGSIPLFDPTFRQAVEKGNLGTAARQVGTEYLAGVAAAPIVGMGVGALNQIAPQAARVVTSGLNTARTLNPIAVVSQLGGSSKINQRADTEAIQSQFARAEAARRRGGRWKFPTPFGTLTIPELGISEAGGLFFR